MPPKVPILTRSVERQLTPSVGGQAPPAAAFGQTGAILQQVGRGVESLAVTSAQIKEIERKRQEELDEQLAKEQEKQDKADAADAMTLYTNSSNDYQNTQILNREQRNAFGVTAESDTFHKELFAKTNENLQTEGAKAFFRASVTPFYSTVRRATVKHEAEQKTKSQKAAFSSGSDVAVQTGATNYDNPEMIIYSEHEIKKNARALSDVSGWSSVEEKKYIDEKMSLMYEGIVRNQAINRPEIVKEYYNDNKHKIAGDRYDDLDKVVNTSDTNQRAQNSSDAILAATKTETEALDAATKTIKDADERAKAKENIRLSYADDRRIEAQDRRVFNDDLTGKLDDMINDPTSSLEAMWELASSPQNGTDRKNQRAYLKAELKKGQEDTTTDNAKYTNFQLKVNNGEYGSLGELRREASPHLNKADMSSLESLYNAGGRLGGLVESNIVDAYRRFTNEHPDVNPTRYQSARHYVEDKVKALDRNMTPTDLNQWMSEALLQGTTEEPGFLFGTTERPITFIEAKEEGVEFVPNIPADEQERIINRLKELGLPETQQDINEYYLETKGLGE
jgi:hypothetical protein